MTEIIQREASSCTLQQLTAKLIPEVIGREIEKSSQGIYPLQNVSALDALMIDTSLSCSLLTVYRSTSARSRC